jgi:hypothetical protein
LGDREKIYLSDEVLETVYRDVKAATPQIGLLITPGYKKDTKEEAMPKTYLRISVDRVSWQQRPWQPLDVNARDMVVLISYYRVGGDGTSVMTVAEAKKTRGIWRFQEKPASPLPLDAQVAAFSFLAPKDGTPVLVKASDDVIRRLQSRRIPAQPASAREKHEAEYNKSGYLYLEYEPTTYWPDKHTVYVSIFRGDRPAKSDITAGHGGTLKLTEQSGKWNVFDLHDWAGE